MELLTTVDSWASPINRAYSRNGNGYRYGRLQGVTGK